MTWPLAFLLAIAMVSQVWAQNPPSPSSTSPAPAPHSAEELYQQLRTVGLSKSRVYQVREVALDRSAIHLALDDGTIAFTEDVAGRVTGAFFEGEGEILLIPPNRMEQASMHLFTGAAILEEKFSTAYFRFNDDTYAELLPQLAPAEHAEEFFTQWNETAHNLAEADAMRLLLTLSNSLPVSGAASPPAVASAGPPLDRMLRARLQGQKLGIFDVFYDSRSPEQIGVGQLRSVAVQSYYDVWASFSPASASRQSAEARKEETAPGSEFSVTQFKIKAEVKPPTTLNAEATLQLEIRRGGARALLFELSRFLEVKAVEADGRAVEFIHNQSLEGTQLARRGNDVVAVIFPQPVQAGQKISLRFVYGGDVLSEAGGGLLYVGARGTWYPNRGVVMSNFDLEFRYPPGWTLIATGKRVDVPPSTSPTDGQAASAPAELVSHWVTERPIPVAGFNLGRYERATAHAGSVTVESYATPGVEHNFPQGSQVVMAPMPKHSPLPDQAMLVPTPGPSPARNAQAVADRSAQAVDFFARRFGPYPYDDLAITQMPGDLSQGWPGLIFLSSFSFLTPREKAQLHLSPVETIISNSVIAHETAHQWWGDLLNWSSYRDQWIVEGLANYSALMLMESEDPEQFRLALAKYRDDLLQKDKEEDGRALMEAGPVTLGTRLSCSRFPNGYEAISYGRGTWLFHMLRYMLRDAAQKAAARRGMRGQDEDEPFVQALHTLRDRFAGKAITTEDLLRVFEEQLPPSLWYEGHKSLDWFYQSWVNGTAVPRYGLQNVKYAPKGGSTVVSGTITQKEAPDDLVTSVPIYAAGAGKSQVLLGRVFADGPETAFHFTAPAGTNKILLDPNQTLLSRNR